MIHLVADADRALNFSLGMNRPEHATISLDGKDLLMRGQLPDGVDTLEMKGMRFASRVRIVLPKGGDLATTDSCLSVRSASEAIILVSLGTDYFDKDGVGQSLENTYRKRSPRISPPCAGNIRSLIAPCSIGSPWIWERAKGIIFRSMSVWPLSLKTRTIPDWRLYISSSVGIY